MADVPVVDDLPQALALVVSAPKDSVGVVDSTPIVLALALRIARDSPNVSDYLVVQTRYKMFAFDSVSNATDTWISPGGPDYIGASYPPTGFLTKPFRFVAILSKS